MTHHQPVAAAVGSQLESIKAIRAKSPPPTDLETLFQRELAEKIKKRCQESQQRQLESCTSSSSPLSRSLQSALPPIPKAISSPVVAVAATAADAVAAEFENPLYQTLDECFSGSVSPPTPPPLPKQPQRLTEDDEEEEEATYAVIDERDASHYQTVVSGVLVAAKEEAEERVYAQVAGDVIQDYDEAKLDIGSDSDAIYENLEEFQEREQTYANIRPPPDCSHLSLSAKVLTALVLDVNAATAAASSSSSSSSTSRSSNSSSSGNSSSSPQQLSSSPEQLSPTDSLANVSVGSVRSIGSPDSGVFGLLKPAHFSSSPAKSSSGNEPFVIKVKLDQTSQQDLLDQTLKQFERLEELSSGIFESSLKQTSSNSSQMDNDPGVLLTRSQEKVSAPEVKPVLLPATTDDKMVPISEIPIKRILDLAGCIVPSEASSGSDEEDGHAPPGMPMSPPPSEAFRFHETGNEDGVFQASLVSVDSQASSSITSTSLKEGDSDLDSLTKDRFIRSPEPANNLGAKIVEDQVKRMKERDRVRNEKLGLENVGESFDNLKNKRYDVIDEMTPKTTKRKDWLSPSPEPNSNQLEPPPLDGSRRLSCKSRSLTLRWFRNQSQLYKNNGIHYAHLQGRRRKTTTTRKNRNRFSTPSGPVSFFIGLVSVI